MIRHEATVHIPASEFDRINRLLAIESLEDMTDDELLEQGANTSVCEGVYRVEFDNGSVMNFDLCSGTHNYWDDVVWTSADGNIDIVLDCEYELGDIEVEIESELYVIKLIRIDDCQKMSAGYFEAVETCPHCDGENVYPMWDASVKGYIAICKHCGKEIFLCDECMHSADNECMSCDWRKTVCGGKCFRGTTKD